MDDHAGPALAAGSRLFAVQRQERIVEELRAHGSVSVRELASRLRVSELTIRRDVNALAARGTVNRVHGGATLLGGVEPASSSDSRHTLGMVVPSLDYYWPQVVVGAREAAESRGARLVVRGSSYDPADTRRQLELLIEGGDVAALIAAPSLDGVDGLRTLRWLDDLPVPVVMVERRLPEGVAVRHVETVVTDHVLGAALAVEHLAAHGHRRIGVLTARQSPTAQWVRRGWRSALIALDLMEPDALDRDAVGFDSADRDATLDAVLDEVRTARVTAVIVHTDPHAIAFVQHCLARGLSVPEDIAVVAYDDEIAQFATPPISAVRPPKTEVGRLAVDLALGRLEDGERPARHIRVTPELIVRDSSALPPSEVSA